MEKEKETEKEVLWKQKKRVEGVAAIMLLSGLVVILFSLFSSMNINLVDEKHITDPSMPISEKDNITYTWTAKELEHQMDKWLPGALVGIGMLVGAYPLFFITVGDKKFHKLHCHGSAEWKYCPECGLRMSRLEE
jgi:hypothetical protein